MALRMWHEYPVSLECIGKLLRNESVCIKCGTDDDGYPMGVMRKAGANPIWLHIRGGVHRG